jgi:hypothetical protein
VLVACIGVGMRKLSRNPDAGARRDRDDLHVPDVPGEEGKVPLEAYDARGCRMRVSGSPASGWDRHLRYHESRARARVRDSACGESAVVPRFRLGRRAWLRRLATR